MKTSPSEKETLYRVAGGLMALMALTVGLSFVHLGALNFPVALAIAIAKALLVASFFMELRHSSRILWVMAAVGLIWLFFLIGGTLMDTATRAVWNIPLS